MDGISLGDLPLPLAVIIAAGWVINQNNAEFAKKLVALIDAFNEKYEAMIELLFEERRQWTAQQIEQNRLILDLARSSTEAQVKNANETHALRNTNQQLVSELQLFIRQNSRDQGSGSQRPRGAGGGDPDAAD